MSARALYFFWPSKPHSGTLLHVTQIVIAQSLLYYVVTFNQDKVILASWGRIKQT